MDMQKSAASRVRHILAAMERSIDTARTRRVSTPGFSGASPALAADVPFSSSPGVVAPRTPVAVNPSAPRFNPAPAPAATVVSKSNPMIGGSPLIGGGSGPGGSNNNGNAAVPAPVADPSQPPRLKAKPKRFEGTFAAQFNPPTYRSQAG